MLQEQKVILIKDLCSRLPYGLKVLCLEDFNHTLYKLEMIDLEDNDVYLSTNVPSLDRFSDIDCVKPYLFPLSSMTKEQEEEYNRLKHHVPTYHYEFGDFGDIIEEIELYDSPESFEYLIKNHFDCHGLIPMGLAIDATGLNIY